MMCNVSAVAWARSQVRRAPRSALWWLCPPSPHVSQASTMLTPPASRGESPSTICGTPTPAPGCSTSRAPRRDTGAPGSTAIGGPARGGGSSQRVTRRSRGSRCQRRAVTHHSTPRSRACVLIKCYHWWRTSRRVTPAPGASRHLLGTGAALPPLHLYTLYFILYTLYFILFNWQA